MNGPEVADFSKSNGRFLDSVHSQPSSLEREMTALMTVLDLTDVMWRGTPGPRGQLTENIDE